LSQSNGRQANKEVVGAIFFDVEKAYDMIWKESLLIKLSNMGVVGRVFNWIKDFIFGQSKVRVRISMSESYEVDNGTSQGSVISPFLFSIMIDDVFSQVRPDIWRSLFADDGICGREGEILPIELEEFKKRLVKLSSGPSGGVSSFHLRKHRLCFFLEGRLGRKYT
jgi:hypothetical protein